MSRIKVSVIGTNHAGKDFHLPGLSTFPDIDLSICDINEELLNSVGEEFNIPKEKRYTDYHQMFKKEDPQAVYVLMAQYSHAAYRPDIYFRIVNEVLEQKRSILVEKPLAMTSQEALPLVEAAEKAGVVSMCSFNRRFNPLVQYCYQEILARGPLQNVLCCFYKGEPVSKHGTLDWLVGDMIHSLDLMRFLGASEIVDFASSYGKTPDDEIPTSFYALAHFASGSTGIFSSNVRTGTRRELFQLHGIGISAYMETAVDGPNRKTMKALIFTDNDYANPKIVYDYEVAPDDTFQSCSGFTTADRYFIDCVKEDNQPHCNFADAYKTIEYCERICSAPTTTSCKPR